MFARYSVVGSLVAALGALCAGVPELIATRGVLPFSQALEAMFVLYGALGLFALVLYRRLSPVLELRPPEEAD